MNTIDLSAVKSKFGSFLSFACLQCQMKPDILSVQIARKPFFDFLERNNASSFLGATNESLCFSIFGANVINGSDHFLNDVRYAGECYISVSVALSMPLRKLFLLYPLDKMLALYPTFHEMGPFRIIERVKEDLEGKTAFSVLLDESKLNLNSLAKLLRCRRDSLTLLKEDPNHEKKLSQKTISALSELLQADPVFFSSSSFCPYSLSLWDDERFVRIFKKNLSSFLGKQYPIVLLLSGEDKSKESHARISYQCIEITNSTGRRQMPSYLFDYLIKISIDDYKESLLEDRIAFC